MRVPWSEEMPLTLFSIIGHRGLKQGSWCSGLGIVEKLSKSSWGWEPHFSVVSGGGDMVSLHVCCCEQGGCEHECANVSPGAKFQFFSCLPRSTTAGPRGSFILVYFGRISIIIFLATSFTFPLRVHMGHTLFLVYYRLVLFFQIYFRV